MNRCKEQNNQKKKDDTRRKCIDYKEKNENGGSGSYQRMKYGDRQNQKYQKASKASELPVGIYSTGIT